MDASANPKQKIRVLQVNDHRLVSDAIQRVLARDPDIVVIGAVLGIDELTSFEGSPDVILMDYVLEDGTGAQATRVAKGRWPRARVVMLTSIDDDDTILEAVQAGADGYLTKDRALDDVIAAVHAASSGELLLPAAVLGGMARRLGAEPVEEPFAAPLTPREHEVLRCLGEGRATRAIAADLAMSPETVRTHIQAIRRKLGAHSKLEAVTIALRRRLIDAPGDRDARR